MASSSFDFDVPSADVLRLIQSHLTECGLHAASKSLLAETGGIGLAGLFPSSKSALMRSCGEGRWGEALRILGGLDLERLRGGHLDDLRLCSGGNNDDDDDDGIGSSTESLVTPLEEAVAMAHEMAILELAENDDVDLAHATLRMCSSMLDRSLPLLADENNIDANGGNSNNNNTNANVLGTITSRSADVERRIAALASLRRSSSSRAASATSDAASKPIPADYYAPTTRQRRRDKIARMFGRHVPEIPARRLPALLQQSVKWQCHTGAFPAVRRLFRPAEGEGGDDDDDYDGADDYNNDDGELGKEERRRRRKKMKKRKKAVEQKFDLVLGNVDVVSNDNDPRGKKRRGGSSSSSNAERIPSRLHQSVRLGKKSYVESACFLPDGRGLVTGSSDGFIEIWGEAKGAAGVAEGGSNNDDDDDPKSSTVAATTSSTATTTASDLNALLSAADVDYEKLRTSDLRYQRDDELMMHDSAVLALAASNDGTLLGSASANGTVCVWNVSSGRMLRRIERAHGGGSGSGGGDAGGAAVTCIQFSPDGSRVLTGGHDNSCREYGLLSSRMLKEFRGHESYVNRCDYVVLPPAAVGKDAAGGGGGGVLTVVTASADGSVRLWDGRTAEPVRVIKPPVPTSANATVADGDSVASSRSVHTVIHLHSPSNAMIVVPRCDRAYLVSYAGAVLRTYSRDDARGTEFLAAAASVSNRYLFVAADDGKCVVFDVSSGAVEKIIPSFADDCSSGSNACEVSGLVCHPHRGFIGGYSNDKGQKRGILSLWK